MARRTRRRGTWYLFLVVIALIAAACGNGASESSEEPASTSPTAETSATGAPTTTQADDDSESDTTAAPTAEGDPIVIGGTLGMTGAFADPSSQFRVAYDYWLERINSEGGLLGRPVEMIIYDDESSADTAQNLYQRLITEDQVDLILGPFATGPGGAVMPVVQANNRVLWNVGFIGLDLHRQYTENMVGILTYNELEQLDVLFDLIASLPEDTRPTRVGFATAQAPFQLMVRDGLDGEGGGIRQAEALGLEVVMNEEYPTNPTDVRAIIDEAIASDVEIFINISFPNDGALFATTAVEAGFQPDIHCVCGSQVTVLPLWEDLGPAGEGVMGITTAWPASDDYRELDELFEVVQQELGTNQIAPTAVQGLAILQMLEEAIKATGTLDEWELRDYVLANTFDTAAGTLSFPEGRNYPESNTMLLQWQNGQNEAIWPKERATADPIVPLER